MIQKSRITELNSQPIQKGNFVLYWMQQSQRASDNHALEFAVEKANELNLPVITFFGLTDKYPEANIRHYIFMFQGLVETKKNLKNRGIKLVVRQVSPDSGAIELSKSAALAVTDCGYLRIQRQWREHVGKKAACKVVMIESDIIVPVKEASEKEEYTAGTLRPKIMRKLKSYLIPVNHHNVNNSSLHLKLPGINISNYRKILSQLKIDTTLTEITWLQGGAAAAEQFLSEFIATKLDHFGDLRNNPSKDYLSNMSPYLHFGQISALRIALEVSKIKSSGTHSFLEELIIRRELAINFVWYNENYDSIECLPHWAQKTLNEHLKDKRNYVYSQAQLENAQTHDPYWNAAQNEMIYKGKMHGYMRMYWGKKILEWTKDPAESFKTALFLNNKYNIDGRDPNSYTGVAWCFGKHDRAWAQRAVFGKVRYMNDAGLKRKFNMNEYINKINNILPNK